MVEVVVVVPMLEVTLPIADSIAGSAGFAIEGAAAYGASIQSKYTQSSIHFYLCSNSSLLSAGMLLPCGIAKISLKFSSISILNILGLQKHSELIQIHCLTHLS